jgi:hypothetical protein
MAIAQQRKPLDQRLLMCWHEAGHVWRCWKHQKRVHLVTLLHVDHEDLPDPQSNLLNFMAGVAVVAKQWGWSYEQALILAGGIGANGGGGDIVDAVKAARDSLRAPPPDYYEDEVVDIAKRIHEAFDQNIADLANPADWNEVTKIANALVAALPHNQIPISGDNIAKNIGKAKQF